MDTCVIVCAGGFHGWIRPLDASDYLLAADGGLAHLQARNLTPDGILGDFDSLGYIPEGAQVFPVEKDDTDSMLAIRKGLALGYRRFEIYGALDGKRLDHTIANLQSLHFLAEHGASGYLIGLHHMATVIRNGAIRFSKEAEGIVSVFCMGTDATGVTLKGLQYSLDNGCLTSSYPLGVSNHFLGTEASISVRNGALTVLYDVENGFAAEERYDADL